MSDLRPGYRHTEVGVIPEEWEVEPVGAFIEMLEAGVSVRSVPRDSAAVAHEEMVLKTSCISKGRFVPSEAKPILPADLRRAKTPAKGNTMLVSRMNTPDLVGEVGFVDGDHPKLFLPDRLWMASPASGRKVNMRWLTALLAHGRAGKTLRDTATGTSGTMKNITKPGLRGVLVPSPQPDEQQAIAEALGDADALIEELEALITKKRDIKQGAMQELLTGDRRLPGFGPRNPTDRVTEAGRLPTDWSVSTVGDQFRVELGKMLDDENNVGTPLPYLGNRAVQWDKIDVSELGVMRIAPFERERFRLRRGDLLVCEGGEVGRAAVWNEPIAECYYQKALHRLRPKGAYDPRLMAAYLRHWSNRNLLQNYVTQTSIAHLPKEKLIAVPLPLPGVREQQAIAAVLSDMDAEITALENKLAKARAVKQGMMQVLLTGEIRLI